MQIEVPCKANKPTSVCRVKSGAPSKSASSICKQFDHMVSHNCNSFRQHVEDAGWSCVPQAELLEKEAERLGIKGVDTSILPITHQYLCHLLAKL